MLTNNVENFHLKDGKNRNFRGPSDGGSAFESRAIFGQVNCYSILKWGKNYNVVIFCCCCCCCCSFQPECAQQFYLQKPRDKKPIRVSRFKRHLSAQQRDLGSRGPTSVDLMLTRTRTPSVKITPTQPTGESRLC